MAQRRFTGDHTAEMRSRPSYVPGPRPPVREVDKKAGSRVRPVERNPIHRIERYGESRVPNIAAKCRRLLQSGGRRQFACSLPRQSAGPSDRLRILPRPRRPRPGPGAAHGLLQKHLAARAKRRTWPFAKAPGGQGQAPHMASCKSTWRPGRRRMIASVEKCRSPIPPR
jgi:hypothetical protein